MFCKYCGKELEDRSSFCKYCGKAQLTAYAEPAKPEQNTQLTAASDKLQNAVKSSAHLAVGKLQNAVQPERRAQFIQHLKATCKLLSLAGWASLVVGVLLAVLTVIALLTSIFTLNLSFLTGAGISAIGAAWCYIFGVHQFWNAAAIEGNLTIRLPKGKDDAAWLVHIRDNFNFEGATLTEQQPENALVYLLNDAQMHLTAENGVLRIAVKHSKRFNSARSGGHWELDESFSADNLKCALALFVQGQPLPDNFAQEQKKKHKDKVGKVKKGIVVSTLLLCAIVLICSWLSSGPVDVLKSSVWDSFSTQQTLGEAFDSNFYSTHWESYELYGDDYVRFIGRTNLDGIGVITAELNFLVQDNGDYYHFELTDTYLNDTALSGIEAHALMQYAFDGDAENLVTTLLGYSFVSALLDNL